MRCVDQHVIFGIGNSLLYLVNLTADAQQRINKAVKLLERLTLSWLNHQRAVYREGQGRRVVTIIHQSLGNLALRDAKSMELPAVQDQLVSYPSVFAGINHSIRIFEFGRHVIGG